MDSALYDPRTGSSEETRAISEPVESDRYALDLLLGALVDRDKTEIVVRNTSDFVEEVGDYFAARSAELADNCRRIIRNTWKTIKYSQEYISFLQGAVGEKAFKEVAEGYAVDFDELDDENIAWSAAFLLNTLDEDLSSGELSMLLNVRPERIERALRPGEVESRKSLP